MSAAELRQAIEQAAQLVRHARRGVVLSGAGFSTSSGIPDFRSEDSGLWQRFDPREVASLSAFRYRPEKFFRWLRGLAMVMVTAEPNPAHFALAKLEEAGHIQAIVTQNVDGLHQRAGSRTVHEVHGTLETCTCASCFTKFKSNGVIDDYLARGETPRCPDCKGTLKPDIILFEEQLPVQTWMRAQNACRQSDLIIVAGSSLEVMPVAGLPFLALENGAPMIMINRSETYIDVRAEIILRADIAEILPMIAEEALRENPTETK